VYAAIVPKGINLVGGRLNGVGVAGFTLGGGESISTCLPHRYTTRILNYACMTGYSWKTNQFGLTLDTVTEYELVLPCGQVRTVTEKDEDLWFGLRGGLNNYVGSPCGQV
jgi:hypothetical protein